MASRAGVINTEHGPVSFFHDDANCLKGEEHDWSGSRGIYDRCEDESHEKDEDHTDRCASGWERYCVKCGMGAMHHSLMTAEE